jgi:hypothetical protein
VPNLAKFPLPLHRNQLKIIKPRKKKSIYNNILLLINLEVFQLQKLDAHTQMSGGSLPRIEEADRTHEFAEQIPAYPSKTCILSTISELLIFSISQMDSVI